MPQVKGRPRPNLKQMRRDAPRQDRNEPAFAPLRGVDRRPRLPNRLAESLEDIRLLCGDYGDCAEVEARFDAVAAALSTGALPTLPASPEVVRVSIDLCREEVRHDAGLPPPEGPRTRPIIRRISPESQDEARRVAADAVREWDRAGRPCLTPERVTRAHQFILACVRAKHSENRA